VKKKQKNKSTKNHFQEIVRISNENNSHSGDNVCCKDCRLHCCLIKEYHWIETSVCEKWLYENCIIFSKSWFVGCKNVLKVLENA
jgi:hypothetical protein